MLRPINGIKTVRHPPPRYWWRADGYSDSYVFDLDNDEDVRYLRDRIGVLDVEMLDGSIEALPGARDAEGKPAALTAQG